MEKNMRLLSTLFIILSLISFSTYASDYKPWSEDLFAYIKKTYGDESEKRMRFLEKTIIENQDKTEMEKLTIANNTINLFPWIADENHWKKSDYWATPLEMITSFGGDCEDMVFTKWIMLRHLGIKRHEMYFAYVKLKSGQKAHMVLLFNPTPEKSLNDSKVYILDNLQSEIELVSKRVDLLGVYAIDPDGKILIVKNDDGKEKISKVIEARGFKKFEDLKKKFLEDREKLKDVNGGNYLLPDL